MTSPWRVGGARRGARTGLRAGAVAALLLGLTLAAGAAPAQAGAPADRGADRGGARPSAGCGQDPGQAPGTSATRTLTSGGQERSYVVHLPDGYRDGRAYPVALAYHGQGRTSAYMEELTGFSGLKNTIAVYPQGAPGTEDGKPSWQGAPYSAPGVDDVRYTADVLDALERDLCVDQRRVHAAGKSNGGGFVALLACRMPERIASFSAVSGAYYPQAGTCEPTREAPVLTFHGQADTTIPYGGEPAKGLPALPDWLAERAALAGCAPGARDRDKGDGVTVRTWHGCDGRGALVHYRIASLAHDWPSTTPNPDSETPAVMDATPVIERFMRTHPLGG
ncbi:alpha/beta hydrolase family esterase [Streptomyces sp. NPDC054796]